MKSDVHVPVPSYNHMCVCTHVLVCTCVFVYNTEIPVKTFEISIYFTCVFHLYVYDPCMRYYLLILHVSVFFLYMCAPCVIFIYLFYVCILPVCTYVPHVWDIYLLILHVCFAHVYVCAPCICLMQQMVIVPRTGIRNGGEPLCVLRLEFGSSARSVSALNHWAALPALLLPA